MSGAQAMPGGPGAVAQIEVLKAHSDARGSLFEPLDDRGLAAQKNVHVVLTAPGGTRGNHWHRHSVETTTVVGPCCVRLREAGGTRDVHVPAGEAWRFTIPAGVVHAYRNTGGSTMVLVSFNTHVHDPENPDTVREEIL
jgi:dTDP-4-dehydrorhamnose 3,5-epimerase-like enzyme